MVGEVELEREFKPRVLLDIRDEVLEEERVVNGCSQFSYLFFSLNTFQTHWETWKFPVHTFSRFMSLLLPFHNPRETPSQIGHRFESEGPRFESVLS